MILSVLIDFIKSHVRTLLRYMFVGVFVYFTDFITYMILCDVLFFLPIYANAVAKIVGAFVAFFLHRLFTFEIKGGGNVGAEFIRFSIYTIINVPLFSGVFYCISLIGLDYRLTKIMADIFSILISYVQARFLVFGSDTKKN